MKGNPENPGFFFNLKETAAIARCSTRTIRRAIGDGQIRGKKIRGRWLFSKKSVVAYAEGFSTRLTAIERKELHNLMS